MSTPVRAVPLAHEVRHATVVGPLGARLPARLIGRSPAHPTTTPPIPPPTYPALPSNHPPTRPHCR